MQHNLRQFPFEPSEKIETRRSSLDIPTHGRVPRWLEDMSSEVERSHSLIMGKEYLEANNNSRFAVSPKSESTRRSTESTPSSSARYGRRSSASTQFNSPISRSLVNVEMDTYLVPKMEEININLQKNQSEDFGFKPLYRNASRLSQNSDAYNSSEDHTSVQSYSPSCLEQTYGRKSRLDVMSDQISTNLTIQGTTFDPNFKSKSPRNTSPQEHTLKSYKTQSSLSDQQSKIFSSFLPKEDVDRRKFEEDFLLLKSKIQKYKRSKQQRKAKFKNQNLATVRRESFQEIPSYNIPNGNPEPEPEVFIIPERPSGLIMIVDILSTWGDRYYVGLNGIELFDSDGNLVQVRKITASPEDVNILPECNGDPRVVTNLLDGINRTQDDMHLWLTPFDSGEHHLVTMEFYKKTELAMIRIWNYNKSRIHSYRGARDVIITLDGVCIFRGEIAQACGSILGGLESFGDTILFTTEESILEKIALNDISFSTLMSSDKELPEKIDRPPTATAHEEAHQRPYTHACALKDPEPDDQLFGAHRLDIALVLNWGKVEYIGLTGLEVIGDSDISLTITKDNLRANNVIATAMLHRLIDDENITTDRKHMWYTQYVPGEEIVISVFFDQLTYIAGVRIWNYNENIEMTFCGARMIKLFLDSKPMINPLTNDSTFLVRRAPGNTHYDYVQEIRFCQNSLVGLHQEPFYDFNNLTGAKEELFENPIMPEGFVFQIVIYTTWGDQYYVGLNGIEVFDGNGKQILLSESNICAHPESVNVLPGVSGDIRTPDKLVDGINDRSDGTHSWLVPVIPKCLNRIYIVFDQPVTISVMKLWNYLKTPTRGVKEFGILVDDLLIYNGILDKINDKSSVKYRTILFTNNQNVLQKEMASLVKHSIDSQATILTNDEPRVTTGGSLPNADQSLRPFTSVNYLNRGRTSQSN